MSEPRKRVGSDGGIIQWPDEISGRVPFAGFGDPAYRRRLRITEEHIAAQTRYMLRALTGRHVAVLEALRRRVRP